MLVLSRMYGESIYVGNPGQIITLAEQPIEIVLLDIRGSGRGGKARIGIVAASQIPVHRKEVYEAIQRELRSGSSNM